jgi:hypothetical protein
MTETMKKKLAHLNIEEETKSLIAGSIAGG